MSLKPYWCKVQKDKFSHSTSPEVECIKTIYQNLSTPINLSIYLFFIGSIVCFESYSLLLLLFIKKTKLTPF
ncbi:MAG: hypothetical protein KU38_13520 [Sulfurovum sp. FS08-3]|nr:MAG: hypothetical protein KU38_13520 [Sulfurovum sp. FS08-3]